MSSLKIETLIAQAGPKACAAALRDILVPHFAPVFCAAKVVEHEVAAFHALKLPGYLSALSDEYDLVMALRVTKVKSRSLLYQVALCNKTPRMAIRSSLR